VIAELDISEDQLGLGSAPGSRHIGPAPMPAQGRISIRYIGASSEPGPSQPKTGSLSLSLLLSSLRVYHCYQITFVVELTNIPICGFEYTPSMYIGERALEPKPIGVNP
jgi:hypothetical protein